MKKLTRKEFTPMICSRGCAVIPLDTRDMTKTWLKGPSVVVKTGQYNFPGHIYAEPGSGLKVAMDSYGLTKDLTYEDMQDLYRMGTAPVIVPGEPIVLCVYSSMTRTWDDPVQLDTCATGNPDRPVRIEKYDLWQEGN